MTTVADVRVSHPELPLAPTLEAAPDLWVRREYSRGLPDGGRLAFLAVSGTPDAFEAGVAVDPTVADPLVVADYGEYLVYRLRETTPIPIFPVRTAELGGHPLDVRNDGGRWALRIEAPDRSVLGSYREYCEGHGIEFELDRITTPGAGWLLARTPLTPAQRDALVAAYDLGYFAEPREASLADVADHLGISMGAASGRLRRGSRTLLGDLLRPHTPG